IRVARATVGRLVSTPLPSDKFLGDLEHLRTRLGYVRDILTDPEITSVRLVVNPEKMVITETQRAYTYLCLYGYTVESLVVNRILPDEVLAAYGSGKGAEQEAHLATIEEMFSPLRTFRAGLMPREVLGRSALERLADELFGDLDPTAAFSTESPMKVYGDGKDTVLALRMPFPMDQKLELYTRKDVLTVQLGAFKRSVVMPYALSKMRLLGADHDDGWLKIRFEGEGDGKGKGRKRSGRRKAPGKASRGDSD
ncbi:MAG: ArsA family ATPase, partial [Thermoplasmata archaeon]|nr:ArsA family ATPase [Thermoplasmata archaeon]